MRIEDEAPLAVVAVVSGAAWIVRDGEASIRLAAGAIGVFRGPDHYTVADDPARPPAIRILPGERCFSRPEAGTPGWYTAQSDPVVGRAIRMLHHNPAHPWTVAELARESGGPSGLTRRP